MLVLVMGMGRSGTSLLMQVLQAAGFDCGTDLLPADEHNPKGYIESVSVISFNISVLNAASGTPGEQFPLPDEAEIERLIGIPIPVKFPLHDFAVKDPRLTLTFPVWYPYLRGFDLRVILARRNTEAIAESVLRASGVSLSRIRYLTEQYVKRGEKYIERYNLPSATIWYEDWFRDPQKNLRLLEGLLERPIDVDVSKIADKQLVRCPGDIRPIDLQSLRPSDRFIPLRDFVTDHQKENLYRLRRQQPQLAERLETCLKERNIEIRKSDESTYHCRLPTAERNPVTEWYIKEIRDHSGRPCMEYQEYSPEQHWLLIAKTSGVCPECLIRKGLSPFRPISIIEPSLEVFLSYLSIRSYVPLFNLSHVKWFVGEDAFHRFEEALDGELEPYFVSAVSPRAIVGDRDSDEDFNTLSKDLSAAGTKVATKFKEIHALAAAFRNRFLQEPKPPFQKMLTIRPGYGVPSSVANELTNAFRELGLDALEGTVAYSFTGNPHIEPSRYPDILRIVLQIYRLQPDCIVSINNAAEFFTRPLADVPIPSVVWYWEDAIIPEQYRHREHDFLLTCSQELSKNLKGHGGHYLGELPVAGAPLDCEHRDEFVCDVGFVADLSDTRALRTNMPPSLLEFVDSVVDAKLSDVRVPLRPPPDQPLDRAAELVRILKPSINLRGLRDDQVFVLFMETEWKRRRQIDVLSRLAEFDLKIYGHPDCATVLRDTPVLPAYQGRALKENEFRDFCHSATIVLSVHPPFLHDTPLLMDMLVPMCEGFLLTDVGVHSGERLSEFFEPQREIACFSGPDDVADRVRHYLAHPEERQAVIAAARERILREHTYKRRAEKILQILRSTRP